MPRQQIESSSLDEKDSYFIGKIHNRLGCENDCSIVDENGILIVC